MPCPAVVPAAAVKYEDPLGTALPPASQPFCDAWKRSEELLHGAPNVPMVCLKPAVETDKKGDGTRCCSFSTFDGRNGKWAYLMLLSLLDRQITWWTYT